MRTVRSVVVVVVIVFLSLQVRQPDRANPASDPAAAIDRRLPVPAGVKAILDRSCRDCHSNETRWPLYAYVAPISWRLAEHVQHGREELNLSTWGEYDLDTAMDLLVEICRKTRSGDMPLPAYARVHRSARLTDADVAQLCAWTTATRRALREGADSAGE